MDWKGNSEIMIDQTKLPNELVFVKYTDYNDVAQAIRTLVIRGAPAIGVSGAFGLALAALQSDAKEKDELINYLENAKKIAKKGTVLGIITFHSLEDRIVKNTFKEWSKKCICPPEAIKCECGGNNNLGIILTKKPLIASKEEIKINPRSRSAKLRGFKFI